MKNTLLLSCALLSLSAAADVVLSEKMDERFGGYWMDINATSEQNKVQVTTALTVQKNLRVCLKESSGSFFRVKQTPSLEKCLISANKELKNKVSAAAPLKGLTIVFDMDETLVTNWHDISVKNPERTTFIAQSRDHSLSEKDLTMTMAPKGVTVRPGSLVILKRLAANDKIKNVAFFSAREDKSAEEIKNYFLTNVPTLKRKYLGVWGRNSLRLDAETSTPSKDLRLLSPDLSNILLIDDNIARVMQKDLNFTIPKFNADLYLDAVQVQENEVLEANNVVLPFVYEIIQKMSKTKNLKSDFYPYSSARAVKDQINWGEEILKLKTNLKPEEIEKLQERKIFEQGFFFAEVIKG